MKTATNTKDLEQVLAGLQPGAVIAIEGYQGSDNVTRNLKVRLLGPDGYRGLQTESLRILQGSAPPLIPDFELQVVSDAMDSMRGSLEKSLSGANANARGPEDYIPDARGGFSRKPGVSEALYVQRVETLEEEIVAGAPAASDKRGVAQAKPLIAKALNLPTDRYVHTLKLEEGRFGSVTVVSS